MADAALFMVKLENVRSDAREGRQQLVEETRVLVGFLEGSGIVRGLEDAVKRVFPLLDPAHPHHPLGSELSREELRREHGSRQRRAVYRVDPPEQLPHLGAGSHGALHTSPGQVAVHVELAAKLKQ